MKKLTQEEFIEKAKQVHGDKYDYSKVNYINSYTKVCIICPIHGEFLIRPKNHLKGNGCRLCGYKNNSIKQLYSLEEFIQKARKVHGDKYDYSKVEYIGSQIKVCIICPIHGEFWQKPNNHLQGQGCPKCSKDFKKRKKTKHDNNWFIEKARKIHGNKYDYSKVNYINSHTKICIICPIHGEFWQLPTNHLKGEGCPKCSKTIKLTQEEFIEKAIEIHKNKYNYSKVNYINSHTKVCIICPIHGEFWQKPNNHLQGQGCPKCNSSKLEEEIRLFLQDNNIEFEEQKKFKWLGRQSLDFYLPKYNIGVECQGKQHFRIIEWSINKLKIEKELNLIKQRDKHKYMLCQKNNIKLLYFSNLGINYPYRVFENKEEMLKEIIK